MTQIIDWNRVAEKLRTISDDDLAFILRIGEDGLKVWSGPRLAEVRVAVEKLKAERTRRRHDKFYGDIRGILK